jgi:hypothetical protein
LLEPGATTTRRSGTSRIRVVTNPARVVVPGFAFRDPACVRSSATASSSNVRVTRAPDLDTDTRVYPALSSTIRDRVVSAAEVTRVRLASARVTSTVDAPVTVCRTVRSVMAPMRSA